MGKRPSFQFYPADWRNDPALRMCSLASRGLWWEMICVMHTCEPYGHLVAAGRAIEPEELARIVGESARDVTKWIAELERKEVFSRTDEGVIYCRRMVRDAVTRDEWRDRQEKSRARHADVTAHVTDDVTPESRRSSTSSSSSSAKEGKSTSPVPGSGRVSKNVLNGHEKEFDLFWAAYPKRVARGRAVKAYLKALTKTDAATILAAAKHFADLRKNEDPTYTAYPEKWLNGECWTDDFTVADSNTPAPEFAAALEAERLHRLKHGEIE